MTFFNLLLYEFKKRNIFAPHLSDGVTGNTSVFGTEESRFEP